jgi:hypothetical protein|tara:strand:- start:240 stop:413 length:174 start_codon:yes stop_codon:yes gene_type:complete
MNREGVVEQGRVVVGWVKGFPVYFEDRIGVPGTGKHAGASTGVTCRKLKLKKKIETI